MKIVEPVLKNVEMSEAELIAIGKLMGQSSRIGRLKAGLTDKESDLIVEMYDVLRNRFGDKIVT